MNERNDDRPECNMLASSSKKENEEEKCENKFHWYFYWEGDTLVYPIHPEPRPPGYKAPIKTTPLKETETTCDNPIHCHEKYHWSLYRKGEELVQPIHPKGKNVPTDYDKGPVPTVDGLILGTRDICHVKDSCPGVHFMERRDPRSEGKQQKFQYSSNRDTARLLIEAELASDALKPTSDNLIEDELEDDMKYRGSEPSRSSE
ncbi:uncharacterized protein CCOS01_01262 [Colletotrichum costaricense]|uniref:Uncharacterized protein n=1 Tax=Colletotrichum costaricense TaxID=1209916 RepID=A0AAI9ZB30_9PEZI|nr:uncharacterized protein CCOS01_01262 [Colletotrichum costaricense]KAK1539948.1 hypothetical protein CCOS01_01262 [Colletotrichum costaricense]